MSKGRKIGIILILFGLSLPLISLGFVSNYVPRAPLILNIQFMEIVFQEAVYKDEDIFDRVARAIKDPNQKNQFKKDVSERAKKEGKTEAQIAWEMIPSQEEVIKPKIAIPYRYIFSFGIVSLFSGIGFIVLSGKRKDEK